MPSFTFPRFSLHDSRKSSDASAASTESQKQNKPKKMSAAEEYWTVGPLLMGFGPASPQPIKRFSVKASANAAPKQVV
jgi:hypothetical protein